MTTISYRRPTGPLLFGTLILAFVTTVLLLRMSWDRSVTEAHYGECLTNLEIIADHQAGRQAAGSDYLSCPTWPPAPPAAPAPWIPSCWSRLGFEPDLVLRGRYSVEADADGFDATCSMDLDGDGQWAVFRTTEQSTAVRDSDTSD